MVWGNTEANQSVVWGSKEGKTEGEGQGRDEGREKGQGLGLLQSAAHQQLLGDELHDQLLGPLLRFPGGDAERGVRRRQTLAHPAPDSDLQVLAMIHVDLARQ